MVLLVGSIQISLYELATSLTGFIPLLSTSKL